MSKKHGNSKSKSTLRRSDSSEEVSLVVRARGLVEVFLVVSLLLGLSPEVEQSVPEVPTSAEAETICSYTEQ